MSTFLHLKDTCENSQRVEIKTVDGFVNAYELQKVDFIKIDVEGWELEVLKGASKLLQKSDAPALMLEYCSERPLAGGNDQNLLEFIKKINGYQIFILKNGEYRVGKLIKLDDSKSLPKFANLFCFLQRHLNSMPSSLFYDS